MREDRGPVLLFDGHCSLCNGWVDFVLARERDAGGPRLRFAALQSVAGRALLEAHGHDPDRLDSLVLVEDGAAHVRSDAALRVFARLRWPWRGLAWARVVPRFLRDPLYRLVARYRYAWFGREEVCRVPEPGERERFLDDR